VRWLSKIRSGRMINKYIIPISPKMQTINTMIICFEVSLVGFFQSILAIYMNVKERNNITFFVIFIAFKMNTFN